MEWGALTDSSSCSNRSSGEVGGSHTPDPDAVTSRDEDHPWDVLPRGHLRGRWACIGHPLGHLCGKQSRLPQDLRQGRGLRPPVLPAGSVAAAAAVSQSDLKWGKALPWGTWRGYLKANPDLAERLTTTKDRAVHRLWCVRALRSRNQHGSLPDANVRKKLTRDSG